MHSVYRRYGIFFIATFLVVLFGLYPALFFCNFGMPNASLSPLNEEIKHKERYSDNVLVEGTVFLLGDSNITYGIEAERLEKELGRPIVNMGSNGGLKGYVLDRAKPHLHDGDIVVLSFVYRFYEDNWHEPVYINFISAYDVEYFERMTLAKKLRFIYSASIPNMIENQWKNFMRIKSPFQMGLNCNGDVNFNDSQIAGQAKSERELLSHLPREVFSKPNLPSAESQEAIHEFVTWCRLRNIKVYMTWPSLLWPQGYFEGKDLEVIKNIQAFYEQEGIEILGTYEENLFPVGEMHNTIWHLNRIGRKKRTENLLRWLQGKEIGT